MLNTNDKRLDKHTLNETESNPKVRYGSRTAFTKPLNCKPPAGEEVLRKEENPN